MGHRGGIDSPTRLMRIGLATDCCVRRSPTLVRRVPLILLSESGLKHTHIYTQREPPSDHNSQFLNTGRLSFR